MRQCLLVCILTNGVLTCTSLIFIDTINGLTLQADGQANPGCVSSPRNKTQVEEQIRGINSESDYSLHNTGNPGITFFVVGHTSHNRCNLSFQEFFMPAEQ